MNDLKINATLRQEVSVNPSEFFQALKESLGFGTPYSDFFVRVKDGELVRGEDVSYHGSPMYEYSLISNNPKWIELFNSIRVLDDFFKNSNTPERERIIESNEISEDEDISPVMRM